MLSESNEQQAKLIPYRINQKTKYGLRTSFATSAPMPTVWAPWPGNMKTDFGV